MVNSCINFKCSWKFPVCQTCSSAFQVYLHQIISILRQIIDNSAQRVLNINWEEALGRLILFSNWLSKNYIPVDREELRSYFKARLKVFYEEELDVPLVLFDQVLDHILRIDWIFRQPQGHLLLIGVSGAGKTTVLRFFAWMNGLSVFQVRTRAISRSFIFSILLGQLINQYNSW